MDTTPERKGCCRAGDNGPGSVLDLVGMVTWRENTACELLRHLGEGKDALGRRESGQRQN